MDEDFARQFSMLLVLSEMSDADFAEKISVSVPTVIRWKTGEAVPHAALRPAIINALMSSCKQETK